MTEYWYNTKTGEVEIGKQSLSDLLYGPFESYEEASRALEIIKSRSAAWEAEEAEAENDGWSE